MSAEDVVGKPERLCMAEHALDICMLELVESYQIRGRGV